MKPYRYCLYMLFISITLSCHAWSIRESLSSLCKHISTWSPAAKITALTSCAGLGAYAFYRWIRRPYNPKPTLRSTNVTTLLRDNENVAAIKHNEGIPNWIKDHKTVTIFCPGYVSSIHPTHIGAKTAHVFMKAGVIPSFVDSDGKFMPCITFDFIDKQRAFNFGQTLDQECLDTVIKSVQELNKDMKIILVGLCRGATTILNYLANRTNNACKNIQAVVLDEPANPLMQEIIAPHLCRLLNPLFPNHNRKALTIRTAKRFPTSIPLFIGTINNDKLSNKINTTLANLKALGCAHLYSYISAHKKCSHGILAYDDDFIKGVNAFFAAHGIPARPGILEDNENPAAILAPLKNRAFDK